MAKKKKEYTLIPRIHNRKIDREIARRRMKAKGMTKICKHDHTQGMKISGKKGEIFYVQSYFAKHWREYAY